MIITCFLESINTTVNVSLEIYFYYKVKNLTYILDGIILLVTGLR